jgi:CrcB protein
VIIALVAVLGGAGAATRFVVDGLIRSRWSAVFPVATVVVNVTGSLLLGLLVGASAEGVVGEPLLTTAGTGFCGGYTTFSTAMVETVRLVQDGRLRRAALNVLGTGALTVAAVLGGIALGRALL